MPKGAILIQCRKIHTKNKSFHVSVNAMLSVDCMDMHCVQNISRTQIRLRTLSRMRMLLVTV